VSLVRRSLFLINVPRSPSGIEDGPLLVVPLKTLSLAIPQPSDPIIVRCNEFIMY
jgi:hypothetical protein